MAGPTLARDPSPGARAPSLVAYQPVPDMVIIGHSYSTATVAAMARLMGNGSDAALAEVLSAAGQASAVLLPDSMVDQLTLLLKSGNGTPLDEASAALALLCEAGQYHAVVQYGSPLLKAAASATTGGKGNPVPCQPQLVADLALSVALAHISLAAGGAGSSAGGSRDGGEASLMASGSASMEGALDHLDAALQVLSRHGVAEPLQQQVAYCRNGVSVAFAEEVLRTTPPVTSTSTTGRPPGTGVASASGQPASAAGIISARRSKALNLLRGALWRLPKSTTATATRTAASSSLAAGSGSWPPGLMAEERSELMAPFRGLLSSAEHIALYAQRPAAAAPLSDQELYDLAVAHLAQGVTTGWPQHVLQALSCFERVAQQSHQTAAADVTFERAVCETLLGRRNGGPGEAGGAPPPAAAASVSFNEGWAPPEEMWWWEDDDDALLRRLEAQLSQGASSVAASQPQPQQEGGTAFSVDERQGSSPSNVRHGHASSMSAGVMAAEAASLGSAPDHSGTSPPEPESRTVNGGKAEGRGADTDASESQRYGWAQSWLELSVLPCFPETAAAVFDSGAGGRTQGVSLSRWFADPRVILFNKLLAVRSGAEGAQGVTAALGSAVAHVSDASRQQLWQLWQAAAQAVGASKQQPQVASPAAAPAPSAAGQVPPEAGATSELAIAASAKGAAGGSAPLASGLLAQSLAALQDVGPRAAAAASAVAAAAAAVGSAAADSPRAVAAAARRMAPFGLSQWGAAGRAPRATERPGLPLAVLAPAGSGQDVRAQLLPSSTPLVLSSETSDAALGQQQGPAAAMQQASVRWPQWQSEGQGMGLGLPAWGTNNVVPFSAPLSNIASGPTSGVSAKSGSPPQTIAQPAASGLVGATGAAPPLSAPDDEDAAAPEEALWAPDSEGHLRPNWQLFVVQRAAAGAGAAAAPQDGLLAETAAAEAQELEGRWRIAAVAAQAVCLGALAAYVGFRVLAGGRAGGMHNSGGGGPLAARVGASTPAAVSTTTIRWLQCSLAAALPLVTSPAEMDAPSGHAAPGGGTSVESVAAWAGLHSAAHLNVEGAAALLRGWAAARAAAPALRDARSRSEVLGAVMGGHALKRARAEADRDARLGSRVELLRVEVQVQEFRGDRPYDQTASSTATRAQPAPAAASNAGEVVEVTAVVVTEGTRAGRSQPRPVAFRASERLRATFRRAPQGRWASPAAGGSGGEGVWRLVELLEAPSSLS